MKYTFRIQLRSCEGALLRALGLIERRRYQIESCTVGEAGGDGRSMEVSVTSTRSGDLLKRQLERLHDVLFVELQSVITVHPQSQSVRPIIRRI